MTRPLEQVSEALRPYLRRAAEKVLALRGWAAVEETAATARAILYGELRQAAADRAVSLAEAELLRPHAEIDARWRSLSAFVLWDGEAAPPYLATDQGVVIPLPCPACGGWSSVSKWEGGDLIESPYTGERVVKWGPHLTVCGECGELLERRAVVQYQQINPPRRPEGEGGGA